MTKYGCAIVATIVTVALCLTARSQDDGAMPKGSVTTQTATTTQATTMTSQDSGTKSFTFHLQRGQYVFLGLEPGTKVQNESDRGIWHPKKVYIDPASKSEKWDLEIVLSAPEVGNDGSKVWKWKAVWCKADSRGVMREQSSQQWQIEAEAKQKVEDVSVEKVDVSKEKGIDGLEFYKIPMTKIDGETYSVVVAIGDKKELFPKAITVAKRFILFDWETWHKRD